MRRLAVFSQKLFRRTPAGLQTDSSFTIQVDALGPYFDEVVVCVPVLDDPGFVGVSLRAPNISVRPLPGYRGKISFLLRLIRYVAEIRQVIDRCNMVLCVTPGYPSILASWLAQRRGVPLFQWVVTDWEHLFAARSDSAVRRLLSKVVSPFINWLMKRLTQNALTFFNGEVLYGGHPSLHYTRVSSTLTRDAFFERDDTCAVPPYRLLYVGRLSGEKGLSYLVEAVSLLHARGIPASLDIVGEGAEHERLERLAAERALGASVQFRGFVPQGPLLDACYTMADVFVLPSLQDMQPRVLLEAMAHSLPVVASNAGGIPTHVRDEVTGLLVAPRDVEALARSVERLFNDRDLRRRLIRQGLEYARLHTVEAETARMMRVIASHFDLEGLNGGTDIQ